MRYRTRISLECPYCNTRTQFDAQGNNTVCRYTGEHHQAFLCVHCNGLILTNWNDLNGRPYTLQRYYKIIGNYKPQINLQKIKDDLVRKDFREAIDCYNNGFYNASMVMSRRAIHQEVESKNAKGETLYERINSLVTSENLKRLLNKVKNFGNSGAHPDFFLYDENGNQLIPEENEKDFAKLALIFLDKYFQDQYEMEDLIASAPNSEIENKHEK
jgi:hypothetical protein